MNLPKLLNAWLEEHGFSQHDLARKSGVTQPQISMIIAGSQYPSPKTLLKLSRATGLSFETLVFADAETKIENMTKGL